MKIFISWSGELSRKMAEALRDWLPTIFQSAKPWVSSQDIRTGSRWLMELAKELDGTNFGLLCITPEALDSPWLNFEAGAIGKRFSDPKTGVVGILFGIPPGNVTGPISQFQNVEFGKAEMFKVLKAINECLQSPLDIHLLTKLFEKFWNELEEAYENHTKNIEVEAPPEREDRELLEEILARIKIQESTMVGFISKSTPELKIDAAMRQSADNLAGEFLLAKNPKELCEILSYPEELGRIHYVELYKAILNIGFTGELAQYLADEFTDNYVRVQKIQERQMYKAALDRVKSEMQTEIKNEMGKLHDAIKKRKGSQEPEG